MTDQPEALRVAEHLELYATFGRGDRSHDAARLLREQHAHIEDLISRNQGLAMQNSLLRATVEAMKRTEAAENEALRRDAERYLYLRNRDPEEVLIKNGKLAGVWIDWEDDLSGLQLLTGDDADAAIDAARGEK